MFTRPLIEGLEGRLLMSATLRGGGLVVTGTHDDDVIAVAINATNAARIDVTVDDETQSFEIARIKRGIRISSLGGEDEITVGNAISLATVINGGKNDDTIVGGGGADRIVGAKGDDDLDGGPGADRVTGSVGEDVFQSTDAESEYVDFNKEDDGVRIALAEAPAPVQASVAQLLAGAPLRNLLREVNEDTGGDEYELEWDTGLGMSAKIQADGAITELEAEIDPATLPAAVVAAIIGRYPDGEITEAEILNLPNTPLRYEVEVENRRLVRELVVTPEGEILDDSVEGRVGE